MTDVLFCKVVEFIRDYVNVDISNLSEDTKLSEDLGIEGDDAVEFMDEFSKKFNVDLSNFAFDKYFGPEGFNPFILLVNFLLRREKLKIPISIRDLAKAAKMKKWINEV